MMEKFSFMEGLALIAAFCVAVKWATKDLIVSLDNLKDTFDKFETRYSEDLGKTQESIGELNRQVSVLETNVHNHNGRLKVLESYHRDKEADGNA